MCPLQGNCLWIWKPFCSKLSLHFDFNFPSCPWIHVSILPKIMFSSAEQCDLQLTTHPTCCLNRPPASWGVRIFCDLPPGPDAQQPSWPPSRLLFLGGPFLYRPVSLVSCVGPEHEGGGCRLSVLSQSRPLSPAEPASVEM